MLDFLSFRIYARLFTNQHQEATMRVEWLMMVKNIPLVLNSAEEWMVNIGEMVDDYRAYRDVNNE